MLPPSPTVRQVLAAQLAEDRRYRDRLHSTPRTRRRRRLRLPALGRPLTALRARRAPAAVCGEAR